MIELQGEIDECAVIVGGFNTRQTENYIHHMENSINTINQSDLGDIEYSTRQQQSAHSFPHVYLNSLHRQYSGP